MADAEGAAGELGDPEPGGCSADLGGHGGSRDTGSAASWCRHHPCQVGVGVQEQAVAHDHGGREQTSCAPLGEGGGVADPGQRDGLVGPATSRGAPAVSAAGQSAVPVSSVRPGRADNLRGAGVRSGPGNEPCPHADPVGLNNLGSPRRAFGGSFSVLSYAGAGRRGRRPPCLWAGPTTHGEGHRVVPRRALTSTRNARARPRLGDRPVLTLRLDAGPVTGAPFAWFTRVYRTGADSLTRLDAPGRRRRLGDESVCETVRLGWQLG